MDFGFSEEQKAVQKLGSDFRKKYIDPLDREKEYTERDPNKRFPWDIIRAAHKVGFKKVMMPIEEGGLGGDMISIFLLSQEIAYGDYSLATTLGHQWTFSRIINANGNEEQKKKFLRPFLDEPDYLFSASITEDSAGSDNMIPYNDPKCGPVASAVRKGNEWVINGHKTFTTCGPQSKLNILWARTDPSKGIFEGLTCILVPTDTPGFRIGVQYEKMGDRFTPNSEIFYDDVRVPIENTLGEVNKGLYCFGPVENEAKIMHVSAPAVGIAKNAYDLALDWCKNRVGGGTQLINHALIGRELAEMKIMIENGANLALKASWAINHQKPFDPSLVQMAKIYTSDMCVKVVRKALELFGGYGIMRPNRIEKLYRDVPALLHDDGTVLANMINLWNKIRGVPFMTASSGS